MAIFRHWRFFASLFTDSSNVKHETASRRPAGPCLTFEESVKQQTRYPGQPPHPTIRKAAANPAMMSAMSFSSIAAVAEQRSR